MNLLYLGPCAIPQNIFEKYFVLAEIFENIFLTSGQQYLEVAKMVLR